MSHAAKCSGDTGFLPGRYANCFMVGYNAFEIVIDFGQYYRDGEDACFHTRIITSPSYATALLETLKRSLEEHEEAFEVSAKE